MQSVHLGTIHQGGNACDPTSAPTPLNRIDAAPKTTAWVVVVLSPSVFGVQNQGDVMSSRTVLSEDLLERCARRAAAYDRENRFFMEDFEELRQANYLLAVVPKEFGGLGLTHVEV